MHSLWKAQGKHQCYLKYPHLAPKGHPARAHLDNDGKDTKALVAQQPSETTLPSENDYICLLGKSPASNVALQSLVHSTSSSGHWIIDSGCTSHGTYDRTVFASYTPATIVSSLDLGANSSASIIGRGDVKLNLCMPDGSTRPCLVKNVLHVPDLRYQLLSVSAMSKLGVNVRFDESSAQLVRKSDASVVGTGTFRNALYTLDCTKPPSNDTPDKAQIALVSSSQLWHERLAHVNVSGIKSMAARGVVKGVNNAPNSNTDDNCVGCVLGKSHRAPIPKVSNSRTTTLFELVPSDVSGPLEVQSVDADRLADQHQ